MANIGFYKVLNTLPVQIEKDSFYLVSDSDRFDLYVTSNGVTPTAARLANVKHLQEDTVPDPNNYYEGDEWLDVLTLTKYKLYYDGTKKIWVEVGNNPTMNPDLVYIHFQFAKNTSAITAPTSGWQDSPPEISAGEYVWMRTGEVIPPAIVPSSWSTAARITGDKGDQGIQGIQGPKGDKGDTGADGQGIDSVTKEYAISTSKTVQPTTGWSTTQPEWSQGEYIWSRVKVDYKNPTSTVYTGYAVSSEWEAVNELEADLQTALNTKVDNSRVLTDVPAGAKFTDTVYTHPSTHSPSIIAQDANNRFVSDSEKALWNAKGSSNLGLGETSTTAYRGDRGKLAYDHSLTTHAPSNAQKNSDITKGEIEAKLTGNITTHSHTVTKADVGLGNVDNKSSSTIRSEITNTNVTNALGFTPMNASIKGTNNGVAELDAAGKVPTSQLPSYVDDVLEFTSLSAFPSTGESGKIYTATDTNIIYRWGGTGYVEISSTIALGETNNTAYRGDRGKIAYDHSQAAHAPSNAQKNSDITKAEIEAKLTGAITSHTHSAYVPTSRTVAGKALTGNITLTKGDVGLGNVTNTSDADKPISTAQQAALDSKQATLIQGSNITITGNTISAVNTTYGVATTSANGLMSSTDKSKLNGIASNANNYSLPTASATVLGGIKVGSRLTISSGVLSANVQSDNNFTSAYKTKLDGIATGANNYTHPSSHPATIITQTSSHRFVTDTEKSTWNAKLDTSATAYDAARLGGYSAASYPRKVENATITGAWNFRTASPRLYIEDTTQQKRVGFSNSAGFLSLARYAYGSTTWQSTLLNINVDAPHNSFRIESNGNVGFGIEPTERLHVAGNGLFTGNLTAVNAALSGTLGVTGRVTAGGNIVLNRDGVQKWELNGAIDSNDTFALSNASNQPRIRVSQTGSTTIHGGVTVNGNYSSPGGISVGGSISATGNITTYGEITAYLSSDKRLKSNITPLTSSLSIIDKLNPVSFNWNDKAVELNNTKNTSSKNYGVIAQELEEVLPDLVHNTNGFKSVDYIQLIGVLLGAVKELNNKIEKLENK